MHVAILATADQMHVEFKICKETLKESEAKLRQGNDLIVCLKNEKKAKIEEEKRGLAEFKKGEKRKRLSQEKRIEKRLVRDGMVVLESGKTIVILSQIVVDMEVKSIQLEKSNETIREKEKALAQKDYEKAKIEEEKRGLAEFKKSEKRKRLSQEKMIEERLVRDGMIGCAGKWKNYFHSYANSCRYGS
jgi:hypothetical protein